MSPERFQFSSVQSLSCVRLLTLCDPMNHSTPDLPVHHQLPKFTQTHVHRVGDVIQPSHPLSSPFPPECFTPSLKADPSQALPARFCFLFPVPTSRGVTACLPPSPSDSASCPASKGLSILSPDCRSYPPFSTSSNSLLPQILQPLGREGAENTPHGASLPLPRHPSQSQSWWPSQCVRPKWHCSGLWSSLPYFSSGFFSFLSLDSTLPNHLTSRFGCFPDSYSTKGSSFLLWCFSRGHRGLL